MTHRSHLARPARVALVAALVLGASPALAQVSVEPQTQTPTEPVAPAAPSAPMIVVPDIAPPAAQAAPGSVPPSDAVEVTDAAADEGAAPPPAVPVREPVRRASRAAEPAVQPSLAPAGEPPVVVAEAIPPVAPVVQDLPVSAPAAAPAAVVEESEAFGAIVAWAAAMAALVLGVFFIFGRRRKAVRRVAPPVIERPSLERTQPAAPIDTAPACEPVQFAAPISAQGGLPHAGAAVALPRTLPESFEERDALLKRMIAARPDRANPFVSRRARAKRARLILQSLGKSFGARKPWIDLSQYPNNWPELASAKSAAA